jgi:hypothetical protein
MEMREQMNNPLGQYTGIIVLGLVLLSIFLLIMIIVLWNKMNRMRADYVRMLNGTGAQNVEQLLIETQTAINRLQASDSEQIKILDAIQERMRKMKSKTGIYRYNAFGDRGHDLSFSIAVLNDYQDGYVISGIHNREETYIYAKPIEKGDSSYVLSPEEKEAINRST